MPTLTPLQSERIDYKPKLPPLLDKASSLVAFSEDSNFVNANDQIKDLFPYTSNHQILSFKATDDQRTGPSLRVGVVLSGGQAPGGHNVIAGLYDALKKIHPDSILIGFCDGVAGIIQNKTIEITAPLLSLYRNQGGFDIIGSGRTKIETEEQFTAAESTVTALGLDGLVIIGGDDSNTNAAFLAEYFKKKQIPIHVIGVPKTIDGDLRNENIEISFGFDTACKVYSEIIGNIAKDALSAKKYYFFVKLMGRSASHITLECALKTQVNMALIGEEIAEHRLSLHEIVQQIVAMIVKRAEQNKNYGVILIPEGVIEFIPEIRQMLHELNSVQGAISIESMSKLSLDCFNSLPAEIQKQLLLERDPHGNVQVSKIETERLFVTLVERELQRLEKEGSYKGKFNPQPLFFGYEGRSALPSNFDCNYAYTLGYVAAILLNNHATGYMACVKNLSKPVSEWEILGVPIHTMFYPEERRGTKKMVIKKAFVDLSSTHFKKFKDHRDQWMIDDDYLCPGPIQFFGPAKFTETHPITIT